MTEKEYEELLTRERLERQAEALKKSAPPSPTPTAEVPPTGGTPPSTPPTPTPTADSGKVGAEEKTDIISRMKKLFGIGKSEGKQSAEENGDGDFKRFLAEHWRRWLKFYLIFGTLFFIVLVIIANTLGDVYVSVPFTSSELNVGKIMLWGLIIYTVFPVKSIRQVSVGSVASKTILNMPVQDISAGPTLAPFGITSTIELPVKPIQCHFGTPEEVMEEARLRFDQLSGDKTGELINLSNKMIERARNLDVAQASVYDYVGITPHRITFGDKVSVDASDRKSTEDTYSTRLEGLDASFTTNPIIDLNFSISQPSQVVRRFGDNQESIIEEICITLEQEAYGILQEIASKHTARFILEHTSSINMFLQYSLEKKVGDIAPVCNDEIAKKLIDGNAEKHVRNQRKSMGSPWGIDILLVRVNMGLPRRISMAMADASAAAFNRQTVERNAEGERIKKIKEGEGTASARLNLLTAEADGRRQALSAEAEGRGLLAKVTETEGGKILAALETTGKVAEKAQYIITPGGGDLLGIAASAQAMLDKTKSLSDSQKDRHKPKQP